jgi:hypothetical protein
VSVDTLARRKQDDPEFVEALKIGKAKGRATLRWLQWQCADAGSDTMMIWLGKNTLGQRDKYTAPVEARAAVRRLRHATAAALPRAAGPMP